ncbi:MAG: outer membrane beta-barrel protein [Saprospiraceae bacterium]|nr:outer membrane beta-barrel protein [Candidatus Vicinibacter affinis]
MKKLLITLTAIVIAIFFFGKVYSQNSFSVHAGPSFPLSEFGDGDIDDDDSGGAGVGLSLGGKYLYQLNDKGLGLYLGADFNYNGLKSDVKDDIKDDFKDQFISDVDIKFRKYINVPVTAGLNYSFKGNDKISLFVNIGIGADILKLTNMTVELDNEEVEFSYKLSTQIAYKIGGGLLINDKFIIGMHYNGLGEHNLKGEIEYNGDSQDLDDAKLKVSLLTLTFGIKL